MKKEKTIAQIASEYSIHPIAVLPQSASIFYAAYAKAKDDPACLALRAEYTRKYGN